MRKTKYLLLIILLIAVTFISMPRIVSAADETTSILKVKEIKIDSLSEKEEENKQDLSIYLINVTNNDVTWTSSDETVATVSADGWLTAKKEGTAIITVTVKDKNIKESCTVTITNEGSAGSTNNEEESKTTETWTDTSNITIKIVDNSITSTSDIIRNFDLKIDGVKNINKNSNYYLYFTNGKTKPTVITYDSNLIKSGYYQNFTSTEMSSSYSKSLSDESILEKNGDIYAWIVESKLDSNNKRENKFILEGYKVERPALLGLGKRLEVYFDKNDSSVFNHNPNGVYNKDRTLKVKIGIMGNNSILKAIKNNESGALEKLLTYSKSAKSTYTGTLSMGKSNSILDKLGVVDGQYYYAYFELDDENGKYYPVEDVMLYQGKIDSGGKYFLNYISPQFTWNLTDNSTSTPTDTTITPDKKLPQTGERIAIIGTIGISVVVAVVLGIKAKKYNF